MFEKEKIEAVMQALELNNMTAYFAESAAQVVPLVEQLLHERDKVSTGGSMTLFQTGVIGHLRCGRYQYYDRWSPGMTQEQTDECFRASFSCDAYLSSSNAITEQGELYNVDGNSNRIAALCYGPKSVIIVAGCNKIVSDLTAAADRVRTVAAPKNCRRLRINSCCANSGSCVALTREPAAFCDGCHSPTRICCNYLISARQRVPGRIKVILVGEPLGY